MDLQIRVREGRMVLTVELEQADELVAATVDEMQRRKRWLEDETTPWPLDEVREVVKEEKED